MRLSGQVFSCLIVYFSGSEREDDFFNILHEEGILSGGVSLDINPISRDETGSLSEYLTGVENYLAEKEARLIIEAEKPVYIDDAAKAGYPDAYVKYTGDRLCKRVYCYIYSDQGLEITPSKVTMNEVPTEDLSGDSDAEGPRTLVIDSATVFDKSCDMQSFAGYKQGVSPLEWFNNAKGPDLLGVYDVSVTGDHIDAVYGIYWWD